MKSTNEEKSKTEIRKINNHNHGLYLRLFNNFGLTKMHDVIITQYKDGSGKWEVKDKK